jgi:hypothetical protein
MMYLAEILYVVAADRPQATTAKPEADRAVNAGLLSVGWSAEGGS